MSLPRVLAALLIAGSAAPAFAQNPDVIEKEAQKPAERQAAQRQSAAAASEAGKLTAPADEVTYEQVLASPDDVALNYRYALTQIRRGDLKGASVTLERILMIDPSLLRVRLMYGVVLLRLDNLSEAQREIEAVLASNPPPELRAEAEPALAEARRRQKHTQLSGRLSAGWEYDDNRNATPASGKRLFGDVPIQLDPSSMRRDDTSLLFLGNVEAHHDLGSPAGHEVFATFNYYRAEQTLVKTLNLTAYSFGAGGSYKTPWFDVTPQLVFDHVLLAQTTFLRNRGVDVRLDKQLGRRADLWFDLHDVRQIYSETVNVPTADDRTGIQVDSTLGADYNLNAVQRLGASVQYTVKHAQNVAFSFDRKGAGLTDTWLLGRGTFLLTGAGLMVDNYWRPDPNVSAGYRRDTTVRLDATYGAPLSLLTPKLQDLLLTVSYEYLGTTSTIMNYAYTNNKVSGLLTYKWAAGF